MRPLELGAGNDPTVSTAEKRWSGRINFRDPFDPTATSAFIVIEQLKAGASLTSSSEIIILLGNTTSVVVDQDGCTVSGGPFINANAFVLNGTISPANLTSSQNNWNPTNLAVASNVRISANSGLSITGLVAIRSGERKTLHNIGSNSITLSHNATGSSSAGNCFLCPGNVNFSLGVNDSIDIWYDNLSLRWRLIR